ncbi:hypothetical protein ACQP2F_35770 [Actinoplanes sp. CA-030573]|uniref:hypothetical protein n=1 Tax=Actinoplanes sp. CA-030573 TaxID=3239898 RepID=UPI003D9365E8
MRRTLLALGITGALALAGCGLNGGAPAATAEGAPAGATAGAPAGAASGIGSDIASGVAEEAIALQQVGFDTGLVDEAPQAAGTPSPGASAGSGDAPRKQLRRYLRHNTLHGEVTIQTKKQGAKTIVVQRGSVTAVSGDQITVKSADGFTLSWTFGGKLRVVQDKKKVGTSALKTGEEIGVAGVKSGDATEARLIAIK